jgi:exonuclease SbcC
MIPIKLALRNFMPYRDDVPLLNFTGVHTASICGDNGSGKSSLIDAMTWALWGRTRAKSDDDLIHTGQNETRVEFEFAVGQQVYRVIRQHTRPKSRRASGQSSLDLFIASPSEKDSFKPISGNRITETQHKIIDILHMDYETFINSAYLRQGHADQFTVAKPAERKGVLANILRLFLYDELEEQARELARQRDSEKAQLESTIKDIDAELDQKPIYEAELGQAQRQLGEVEKVLAAQESRRNELRHRREFLNSQQQQLAQLEEHMAETDRDLKRWEEQAQQYHLRIREYEELIAQRARIEDGYAQLAAARKLNDELNQKLRRFTILNERRYQLEKAIERASQTLNQEHALTISKITDFEEKFQKLSQLRNEWQQAQLQLSQLTGTEEALQRKRQHSQTLVGQVHELESSQGRLQREMAEIEEKLSLLMTESGAKCPLCEQELGVDGLNLIKAKYAAEKETKSDMLKSSQNELTQKKTESAAVQSEISEMEIRLNQARASAQGKVSLLNQEISEAEKAGKELHEARTKLAGLEERLVRKDFAQSEQIALYQVEGELAELDYDAQKHEQLRYRLTELEPCEAPQRRLEEADRLVNQERDAAARAEQAAQELRLSLESDNRKRGELTLALSALPEVVIALTQVEAEYQALRTREKEAQVILASVTAKLKQCQEREAERKDKEKLLTQAIKDEGIYKELAEAFGKKGIQALLIEQALPEIETETNRLLARMTDNRMHVKIETQRATRKGDVAETLDIYISDELGTRPYEMFSGGEAFRINFAIRIALSKLLAHRAGAPLPTLIIDEGFGTQDATGLEKLKEAITSIQDDFQKILVVTHIEDFRDAFPTRIDVIKTPEGSTIEVS